MKKHDIIFGITWLVIGAILTGLSLAGLTDEFWSGMGAALIVVGGARLLRSHRLGKSSAYREKMEIESTDERLHFIRSKAWAWAGYLFILIGSGSVIIFRIMGLVQYSMAAAYAVCLMLVLFWGSFLVLKRKY